MCVSICIICEGLFYDPGVTAKLIEIIYPSPSPENFKSLPNLFQAVLKLIFFVF